MKNSLKIFFKLFFFIVLLYGCQKTNLQSDLELMYKTIVDNHPGIYNTLDPKFKEELELAYNTAKQKLANTSDLEFQKQIITDFGKSFQDGHLRVYWNKAISKISKNQKINESFKVKYLDNNQIVWIPLPTFYQLSEQQEQEFNMLVEDVPEFRTKQAIVFDLRGNTGGNSEYGARVLAALFGKDYFDYKDYLANAKVTVDYRASRGNLEYITTEYNKVQSNSMGNHDRFSSMLKQIIEGMKNSIELNKPYYNYQGGESPTVEWLNKMKTQKLTSVVRAKIIVIIDSHNASAALDFLDQIKLMQPLTLVGQKTSSDRLYIDIRSVDFPSKLGSFVFPMKVYRNRLRADNVPYVPDFVFDTSDTENLIKFITNLISKQR